MGAEVESCEKPWCYREETSEKNLWIGVGRTDMAVSYTHLDVYKRQDRLRGRGSLPAIFFYQAYFIWQTITAANSNRIK